MLTKRYAIFSEDFIKNDRTPTKVSVDILRKDLETLQKKWKTKWSHQC